MTLQQCTNDDHYQELANAIVLQAVYDYRKSNSAREIHEIESFFRSNWFRLLTKVNPDLLIAKLREEKLVAREETK